MTDAPSDVWNEIRFTSEGISISLFSESPDTGAILEDETWFTYDELQEMSPSGPLNLSLTEQSRSALAGQETTTEQGNSQESGYTLPEVGQIVRDTNPPSWSKSPSVEVVGISDATAGDHVIEVNSGAEDITVMSANPDCNDPDQPVIIGKYIAGSEKTYAFPLNRLDWDSESE